MQGQLATLILSIASAAFAQSNQFYQLSTPYGFLNPRHVGAAINDVVASGSSGPAFAFNESRLQSSQNGIPLLAQANMLTSEYGIMQFADTSQNITSWSSSGSTLLYNGSASAFFPCTVTDSAYGQITPSICITLNGRAGSVPNFITPLNNGTVTITLVPSNGTSSSTTSSQSSTSSASATTVCPTCTASTTIACPTCPVYSTNSNGAVVTQAANGNGASGSSGASSGASGASGSSSSSSGAQIPQNSLGSTSSFGFVVALGAAVVALI